MTTDILLALLVTSASLPLARIAYRRGFGRTSPRLPAALVAELRTHKLACLGEPRERVALELSLLLDAGTEGEPAAHPHRSPATTRGRSGATA